ncbi:MAG: hypothetical protein Q4E57_02275 [Eubacteriales bacterium]|nr:hypothetical protein [Eubacteriales bacterium]
MEQVRNGRERQERYSSEYDQFKKAKENGFYIEAIAIGYAIIEDRLVAFLHHAGIVSRDNKSDLKINKCIYPFMRRLLGKPDGSTIRIKDIKTKLEVLKAILALDEEKAREIDEYCYSLSHKKFRPAYMQSLYHQVDKTLNRQEILQLIGRIEPWKNDRNVMIHALLSQKNASVWQEKKRLAEECYSLTRDLDNKLVRKFKTRNTIRKKYNIQ